MQLMSQVSRGDTYAAGAWLRRLARDPSVHPWLLLDQLTLSVQQELAPARGERGASGIRRQYRAGAGGMTWL